MKLGRLLGCVALVELLAGCYVLQPATGAGPEPGALMAMEVNDLGRLALGGQMGPEIQQVEGRLVSKNNGEYQIAVSSVKLIRGGAQVWSGEKVTVKPEYISQTFERRLSKSRTAAMAAVFVVGVYTVVRSQDLFGLGKRDPDPVPCDTNCPTAARFPRRP